MNLLTWIFVGFAAGLLATAVVGGIGYGAIGDVVVGMLGAVVGSWLIRALNITVPVAGILGTLLVAFIGAVVLLVLIRLLLPGGRIRK